MTQQVKSGYGGAIPPIVISKKDAISQANNRVTIRFGQFIFDKPVPASPVTQKK